MMNEMDEIVQSIDRNAQGIVEILIDVRKTKQ